MNQVSLTGRITRDLEVRVTSQNIHVLDLSIAVKRRGVQDKADFIDIQCWRQSADFLSQYAYKGTAIGVTGELRMDKYTDKEGRERRKVYVLAERVEILSQPKDAQPVAKTAEQQNQEFADSVKGTEYENHFGNYDPGLIDDSDLPFY